MKRMSSFLLALVIVMFNVFTAFAHSGRTDSSEGHKDNKNASGLGSYHYHCGGYPAHLHTNGVCPYTSSSSTSGSVSNNSSNSSSTTTKTQNSTSSSTQSSSASSNTKTSTPTTDKQKAEVTVEKANVYKTASTKSEKLTTIKEGYTFTIVGSTKSFWKLQYKLKNDDTKYSGYVLKSDTKEIK